MTETNPPPAPDPAAEPSLFNKRAVFRRDAPLLVGERSDDAEGPDLPGWRLTARLGAGAFGQAWAAESLDDGRPGVAKVFDRSPEADSDAGTLIRRAERLVRVGRHPLLAGVLVIDPLHRPAYLVRRRFPATLGDGRRRRGGPVAAETAAGWFEQLAVALHALHCRGVFHADLHPDNVLLDEAGRPHLADFGQHLIIAATGPRTGKALFMAPEQAVAPPAGKPAPWPEASWDLYSLGAVMYLALTGTAPHADRIPPEWLADRRELFARLDDYRRRVSAAPPPVRTRNPAVDPSLGLMVDTCLAPVPEERYASAAQLVIDLRARAAGLPISLVHLPPGATVIR